MMEWRTSKIKDYETKFPCWVDEDGKKCLNTATYCLTYASLSAGFNIITEANYKEIYTRIHMQEKLFGAYRQKIEEGEGVQVFYTLQEIKDHVGFETNASPKTRAQFTKQMWDNMLRETVRKEKEAK